MAGVFLCGLKAFRLELSSMKRRKQFGRGKSPARTAQNQIISITDIHICLSCDCIVSVFLAGRRLWSNRHIRQSIVLQGSYSCRTLSYCLLYISHSRHLPYIHNLDHTPDDRHCTDNPRSTTVCLCICRRLWNRNNRRSRTFDTESNCLTSNLR